MSEASFHWSFVSEGSSKKKKTTLPTLIKWKKEYEAGSLVKAKLDEEFKNDLSELKRLKDRIDELEKENKLLKKSTGFLFSTNRLMAFRFIEQHSDEYATSYMLRKFNLNWASYYNYLRKIGKK